MRRLWALLTGLPPDGNLARAVGDRWPAQTTEELLATLCELVDFGNRVSLKAWGGKPGQQIRVPRPGAGVTERVAGTEANGLLAALVEGG